MWGRRSRNRHRIEGALEPAAATQDAPPLRDAFTPTRPQRGGGLVGRQSELVRIIEAIEDEQAHVILYAERGRGKTSVANRVTELLRNAGYCVGRHVCDVNTDFDSLMRGLARDLPASFLAVPYVNTAGLRGCEAGLPHGALEPDDIAALPSRLNAPYTVMVVDEFDRVGNELTRDRLADTLKQVSDRAVNISFFIIGVSSSLDELLGRHPSIRRNIVGIHLPPLQDAEVAQIIARGAGLSALAFPDAIVQEIIALASGSPYIAHLLGLRVSQSTRKRGDQTVNMHDLGEAVRRIADEIDPAALASYSRVIANLREQTDPAFYDRAPARSR